MLAVTIVAIVAAVIVAGILAAGLVALGRRRQQQRHGPQCGRLAGASGSRLTDPAGAGYAGQRAGIR
jgi:hypothetical protein